MSLAALLLAAAPVWAQCTDNVVDIRGDFGQARFRVEIADDPAERSRGLMNRDSLPLASGMLFVYDAPGPVSFWMKNTLIPLDMIFVGADGRVRRVHDSAVPHDITPIDGGREIFAVLEINGGLARRIGIAEGSVLRHPVFGVDAAWPCPPDGS